MSTVCDPALSGSSDLDRPARPAPGSRALDGITIAAIGLTLLGWSSAFPAIRAGLAGFGPIELGALRFALAALPAALYLAVARPTLPARAELWRFVFGGTVFVALYAVLLNIGQTTVSAGAASFIINVNPILTAILAMAFLGERFGRLAWAGTALSFTGIGLIALGEGQGLQALTLDRGTMFILGAALCTASTTVVQKPLFQRHGGLTVAAWNILVGAALLSPWLPSALGEAQVAGAEAVGSAVYLALVPGAVAYAAWAVALSRLPAARATNFLYCVPPFATLIGYVWLGEVPTLLGVVGGLMALGGVVVVNLKRLKAAS
ncbi:MAG TPA: DMT family transporter [Beijerinckiaceae bacterium]